MATYFVSAATGSDADDGLSEANAFLTLDKAMNTVAAGDKVWVKADGDYTETATIDTVGTGASWIVFEGYTSSTGDGGKATIDGASTRANGITTTLGAMYYRFENFIIKSHTGNGFNAAVADLLVLVNCEFNLNGARGLEVDNALLCVNCSATDNSTDGFGGDGGLVFVNCTAHSNTGDGFDTDTGGITLYNCRSSSNGLTGLRGKGSSAFGAASMFSCTVDGDGKVTDDGFKAASDDFPIALVNTIFYDCVDGIDGASAPHVASQIGLNNLLNNNTANYANWNPTSTDVTGAPSFTDEANQDYTLGSGSAAKDAGADNSGSSSPGMDIGAHQTAGAAGGGGLLVHPGMEGGLNA